MKKTVSLAQQQEILDMVDLCLEEFVDDVLPLLPSKGFHIYSELSKQDANTLILTWHWDHLEKTVRKKLHYSATEPQYAFTDRVKAYFFDLAVMICNL